MKTVDTSIAAYAAADTVTQRQMVLDAISATGSYGMTADELVVDLGLPVNSVTPRVWELRKARKIVRTSEKRTTRFGRLAYVYTIA